MKLMGKGLIALGLLLFGITPLYIPICCVIGGIAAIEIDKEIKY